MKKLLPLLILALLLTACSDKPVNHTEESNDSGPTRIDAPVDPSLVTTAAPRETSAPVTSDDTTADTTVPDTTAIIVPPPVTSTAEVVKPIPMNTYRLQHKTDAGTYLLDADYSMSLVEPDGDPIFHKSTVTEARNDKIVYCSDLDTSIVLDSEGKVKTLTYGKLASPLEGHWFLYKKEDGGKYRCYSLESSTTFTDAVRGYNKRPDGQIALLGEKDIFISNGKKLTDQRKYNIIYYFASTYLLVNEGGVLRFYDTSFNLLADWGEISGSNRIHFDETKRDGDSFEFFFDKGSYKYTPGQSVIEDAEIVVETDNYTLLRKDGKFYIDRNGKISLTDIPNIDLICVNGEPSFIQLVDRSFTHYRFMLTTPYEIVKADAKTIVKLGNATAVNLSDPEHKSFLFDKNGALIADAYGDYKLLGDYLVNITHGPKNQSHIGNLVNGEISMLKSPIVCGVIYSEVNGKLLSLNGTKLQLTSPDGKVYAVLGDISSICEPMYGLEPTSAAYTEADKTYRFGFKGKDKNAKEINLMYSLNCDSGVVELVTSAD